jgi:hypothetical protein
MELVRAPASNVDDPAPSPQLMHRFAEALAHWTRNCAGQVTVASHLELLSTYEEIIHREIGRSSSELERSLLRGERSSWRLLRKIYENYEQKDVGSWEQYPPQEPPEASADWGADLRELGREAGELRELPPLDQSHARDRARQSHDGELSLVPASAGLRVRALHDERLLEEQLRRAEPQLELAEQLKQWLEEGAIERVVEKPITFRHTKQHHREVLRDQVNQACTIAAQRAALEAWCAVLQARERRGAAPAPVASRPVYNNHRTSAGPERPRLEEIHR